MKKKFKKGAASFYIVAISTLILLIIATSFAAVIISEIERTSNDDLSQSAYDSALAGIEDAKVAFANYEQCKGTEPVKPVVGKSIGCAEIVWLVKNPDCGMVGKILGRIGIDEESEVMVEESGGDVSNNMQQAYTCVKMQPSVDGYVGTLSSSSQMRIIRAKFDEDTPASKIKKVVLNWFSDINMAELSSGFNYANFNAGKVTYPGIVSSKVAVPPTIALAMVQTAESYNFEQFDMTQGSTTNRGMIYMTPVDDAEAAGKTNDTYIGAYNGTENHIDTSGMLKSNNKTSTNLPYGVYCADSDAGNDFACTATIDLPDPVGGTRSNDTFTFAVFFPYGQPKTDFLLQFYCADGVACGTQDVAVTNDEGETVIEEQTTNLANLDGVQIAVDSTGRANDLYRRVEVRLEAGGGAGSFLALMGPLQLLGNNDGNGADMLKKDYPVTAEYNFKQ